MGTRIVTTDVEIIAAAIEAITQMDDETREPHSSGPNEEHINHAAHLIVRKLTMPPEKTSDITGFEEDDG